MSKIVVVEDSLVLATIYRNKLVAGGFQVEVAADGEAGLDLINSSKPDLVILDVMLPKLNGITVLRKVRENPLFKSLPVIILSNAVLLEEKAWEAGATMVLSKSSHSPNQVVESVRTALEASSENQPTAAATASTGPAAVSPEAPLSTQSRVKAGHVLLVEDHPDTRALISLLLDQSGHQVVSVESHAEALQRATLEPFDLYLINRACPDGLGLSLCEQLRQLSGPQPIVMYSTAGLPAEQQAALAAGASSYLTKPSDLLNIGNLLSDLIKESKTTVDLTGQTPPAVSPVAA